MKKFILGIIIVLIAKTLTPQINNLNLIKHFDVRPNQPPSVLNSKYSLIWGWTSPQDREYAVLCCVTGTSFIEITDSNNIYESDFVPDYLTFLRDCKTYLNYAYVTSENYNSGQWSALQIIDMRYLPDSVHFVKSWTFGDFKYAHTITQENNFLYLCGGNVNAESGITIIDVTDPENPVKRGEYLRDFVHECFVKNDTIYAAVSFINKFVILDATNKDSIREIAEFDNYPGYYLPHSCALTVDGNFLITSDESVANPGTIAVWGIHDLNNIEFISLLRPSGDNTSIAHNIFIKNHILYASHHTKGFRLFDIRNPYNISEFAYHDTYPISDSTRLAGNDGNYPFFQSGKIISSDMQTGLYVYKIIVDPTSVSNNLNNIIENYYLSQNYPNPFNPITKIKFAITQDGKLNTQNVKLMLYDALGKQIATLVNEKLPAGSYEVKFDGSNFPSGIYFYKLTVAEFYQTKKMVLLK